MMFNTTSRGRFTFLLNLENVSFYRTLMAGHDEPVHGTKKVGDRLRALEVVENGEGTCDFRSRAPSGVSPSRRHSGDRETLKGFAPFLSTCWGLIFHAGSTQTGVDLSTGSSLRHTYCAVGGQRSGPRHMLDLFL